MDEEQNKPIDPYYGEHEDTDETSLAGKIPVLGWYLRTTKGLGKSRAFFMPLGFLALSALAFFLGYPRLENIADWLLLGVHKAISALGGLLSGVGGSNLDDVLDLSARRAAAPALAAFWATLAALRLALGALPTEKNADDLGYVVPGSGILARAWGAIGKRIHQLKRAVVFFAAYLRDINIEKIHLPITILMLLVVAGVSLAQAAENLLFELPAHLPGLAGTSGWIFPTSMLIAVVCILVLGIPMLHNSLLKAHLRSVKQRRKKVGLVRRMLSGILGLIFIFVPLAWMTVGLLGG
jgi:hypothetical protein